MLRWELIAQLDNKDESTYRLKVHGGWLIKVAMHYTVSKGPDYFKFISDSKHEWNIDNDDISPVAL